MFIEKTTLVCIDDHNNEMGVEINTVWYVDIIFISLITVI